MIIMYRHLGSNFAHDFCPAEQSAAAGPVHSGACVSEFYRSTAGPGMCLDQ